MDVSMHKNMNLSYIFSYGANCVKAASIFKSTQSQSAIFNHVNA